MSEKKKNEVKKKHQKPIVDVPENKISIDSSNPNPGSMTGGKQTNSPLGRRKTTRIHTKMWVTGSDEDGQAV